MNALLGWHRKLLKDMPKENKNFSKSVVMKDQMEELDYNLYGLLQTVLVWEDIPLIKYK